jgi:hypothetical protein
MAPNGIPLNEWSGSGAIKELEKTLRKFNEETSKQTRQLLILTWAMTILTVLMTIGVVIQIYLALQSVGS